MSCLPNFFVVLVFLCWYLLMRKQSLFQPLQVLFGRESPSLVSSAWDSGSAGSSSLGQAVLALRISNWVGLLTACALRCCGECHCPAFSGLMAGLFIQAELVAEVSIQASLLARLSYHICLDRVIGCVPWQGRVVLLITLCNWAGTHVGLHSLLWSHGAPSYAPWLDGVIGWILHTVEAIL